MSATRAALAAFLAALAGVAFACAVEYARSASVAFAHAVAAIPG